jgi:2-dehydro-3-deoxyphosphogluconate aldolase/(4S)-4-hydroxy-2-oxoglutarate aldolase
MANTPLEIIAQNRLVPVIALEQSDLAVPLAEALIAGGLPIAEITFRTAAAEQVIRSMVAQGGLCVGAGTVLSIDQVDQAQEAGAQFIVSPGFNPAVVRRCLDLGLTVFPGTSTPSDLDRALDHGLTAVKFFPAEAMGGVAMLKAIAAPYQMMRFIPTGGIGPENLKSYLSLAPVIACGGSWMVKPQLFADGNFTQVEQLTREAVATVQV